jgi:hypothetical protein
LALITTLISSNPLITLHTKLRRRIWRVWASKTPWRGRHSSRHESIGLRRKRERLLHLVEVEHLLLRRWLLLIGGSLLLFSPTSSTTSTPLSHEWFFYKAFFLNIDSTVSISLAGVAAAEVWEP